MPAVQRHPDALWTAFDHHVVVLSVATGRYFETQGVGGEIWRLLDSPHTAAEIVDRLTDRYHVDRDRCERDVSRFLQSLREAGLVDESGDAPPPSARPAPVA